MTYKERLQKIDTDLGVLISRANALRTNSYTVAITGTGGYYDDMSEQSVIDYSIDGGKIWLPVFTAEGTVVSSVDATQIQFRLNDNMFMIYDFYITTGGVRKKIPFDDSDTWCTKNITLTGNAEIEYELS